MDPARHPSPGDRAERHVFDAVPALEAVPRRALALAELADIGRAGIAGEIGLAGPGLSATLALARKALRRSRAELASGGRCERAEHALSDRRDGVLPASGARFLDAHLARCTRCREHGAELEIAVEQLRSTFATPRVRRIRDTQRPRTDTSPVEPPVAEPAAAPRARLRVVPAPALLPAAPEPPAIEEPAPITALPSKADPAPVDFETPPPAPLPVPAPRATPDRHQRIRAALPVAVAALIAVGLIAAAIALLSTIGDDSGARAPWDAPNAPIVHPTPLSEQ
jgi:hypothetical protein